MKTATKIKVAGVGGAGGNSVSRMMKSNIKGVELIAFNADIQDLKKIRAHKKIQIGKKITQGLGAGMNPEIGQKAAEEQKEEIQESLKGADMIFIACGLGGGCGSGAAPVIADIARNLGALTVAVAIEPFSFEGRTRKDISDASKKILKEKVDTLLVISNDKLLEVLDPKTPVLSAFWIADEILREAVQGITDLIFLSGMINVDFTDVKTIMKNAGQALIGIGKAQGEKRAEKAARKVLKSSLLDFSIKGAKGVLFNISSNDNVSLSEIDEISKIITQEISEDAKVIFGVTKDIGLKKDELKIILIATGF